MQGDGECTKVQVEEGDCTANKLRRLSDDTIVPRDNYKLFQKKTAKYPFFYVQQPFPHCLPRLHLLQG